MGLSSAVRSAVAIGFEWELEVRHKSVSSVLYRFLFKFFYLYFFLFLVSSGRLTAIHQRIVLMLQGRRSYINTELGILSIAKLLQGRTMATHTILHFWQKGREEEKGRERREKEGEIGDWSRRR